MTPSQLAALSSIERSERVTMGDLCAIEHVQPPSMSRIVAALVDAGLVTRETDAEDRRVAWVRATPEGARVLRQTRRRKDAYLVHQLRALEPRDLETLTAAADVLDRLVEAGR
jgi:DNA-binding MarR family transcriptional regulator